jgi:hypothetical protein
MAVKTFYATSSLVSVHQEMSETVPGSNVFLSPVTGWIVGTAITNRSKLNSQVESSTFDSATYPNAGIDTTNGDCFRSTNTYTGTFAAGNWSFRLPVASNTALAGSGRGYFRLYRGTNATGSGATQITSSASQGSTVALQSTALNAQTSFVSFNPGSLSLTAEYLFLQVAWERTVAGAMSTADVNIVTGVGSVCVLVTTDFTAGATPVALTATLSLAGALTRRITDAGFTAALSFAGAFTRARLFLQSLTGILFGGGIAYYRSLTVDHTLVPSTQTDFPVLVSITDATLKTIANGGRVANSNGYDIGFYSDSAGTTPLKWEIERYNASTGEVVAWVKIASVSSSVDAVFYLRYGDSSITTDHSDPVNVWTNNYAAVYHLRDGTTLSVDDSLGANNGTNVGTTATTGKVDGAANFAAASVQYINVGTGVNPAAITYSAWVYIPSFYNAYANVIRRFGGGTSYSAFMVRSSGKIAAYFYGSGPGNYDGTGTYTLTTSTWYYLALTYDSSAGLVGYVNANVDGTAGALGSLDTGAGITRIGGDSSALNGEWNGVIDEARISSVARSANWITTEYNNQNAPGTFVTLGTENIGTGASAQAGNLVLRPAKSLSASLSFAAALSRRISKALTATLSFVGVLTKRIIDAGFTAAVSFIGNLASSKLFVRALTATLLFVGSLATQFTAGAELFFQAVSGTLSFVGAQTKRTSHRLTGTLSFIGVLAKRFAKTTFTAAISFIGTFAKLPKKVFSGAVSFIGAITRRVSHILSSVLSFVGNLESLLSHVGEHFLSLAANLSFVGTLNRSTRHIFSSILSFIGSLGRRMPQRLSGALSFVGVLAKRGGKRLTGTVSFIGSLAGTAAHLFSLVLPATLSFIGALTSRQLFGRVFTATLNATGALTRRTAKMFASSLAVAGALMRGMARTFGATLAFVGFLFRGGLTFFFGGQIAGSTLRIHVTGSTARIVRAGSELEIHRNLSGISILVTGSNLRVERTT